MAKTIVLKDGTGGLNELISFIRNQAEITQVEMCNRIEFKSKQTYNNFEKGAVPIGLNFLLRICKAFGYTVSITVTKNQKVENESGD